MTSDVASAGKKQTVDRERDEAMNVKVLLQGPTSTNKVPFLRGFTAFQRALPVQN